MNNETIVVTGVDVTVIPGRRQYVVFQRRRDGQPKVKVWGRASLDVIPPSYDEEYEELQYPVMPFYNHRDEQILLVWSPEVESALGMPFIVLRQQLQEINRLEADCRATAELLVQRNRELTKYAQAGFWRRVLYALTGRMNGGE